MELISRIKAVLRRSNRGGEKKQKKFILGGDVVLDYEKYLVTVKGKEVTLTNKEFELLYYLMNNPGIVLSRDMIMEKVWGGFDFQGGKAEPLMFILEP